MKFKEENKDKIVLLINELHHDLIDSYHEKNIVMHHFEENNWKEIFNKIDFKGKKVVEIGTGTGFLSLIFAKNNVKVGEYTCSDISQTMLDLNKQNLSKINTEINFEFKKLNGKELDFEEGSVDIIVMNSVLHHLPDIEFFFEQAYKILKKDGYLIIGHEPNKNFYKNLFLYYIFIITQRFISFIGSIKNKILGIKLNDNMIDKINEELLKQGLISNELTEKEIMNMIDFHSDKGIDYKFFPNDKFNLEYVTTYNYFGTLNFSYSFKIYQAFMKIYEKLMSKLFKNQGFTYNVIYKKI